MDKLMKRFLTSINITNIEDFDMSFDLCARNVYDSNTWDMVIVKETPWSYPLLNEFMEAINHITYKYSLSFSYVSTPTKKDVLRLFEEWFLSIYHVLPPFEFKDKENTILIVFKDEDEKKKYFPIVKDFKDFLDFIFYDFDVKSELKSEIKDESKTITIETKKKVEEKVKSSPSVKKTTSEVKDKEKVEAVKTPCESTLTLEEEKAFETKEVSINPEEMDEDDLKEVEDLIEQEHAELKSEVEDKLLVVMKENEAIAKREREMARRNKRGNYTPFDLIDAISENSGNVDFDAKIFSVDDRTFGKKTKLTIGVADKAGGAIDVIMYFDAKDEEKIKSFKKNINVRVRGCPYIDDFTHELTIKGHFMDLLPPDVRECDSAPIKRVELHLHTKMSTMDGVSTMVDYCAKAKALGMKAIGITDHGVVQGFPDAQDAAKKTGLKILYGCEFYMVEDRPEFIKNPSDIPLNRANYVVLDLETTGLSSRYDRIIEFGAVRIEKGIVVATKDILIDPKILLSEKIKNLTHITDEMLKGQKTISKALVEIKEFCKDAILVSHNADFDIPFLNQAYIRNDMEPLPNPVIDTLWLSRYVFPNSKRHNLGTLCRNMDVAYDEETAHRADYDASVTSEVWLAMLATLTKSNYLMKHKELGELKVGSEMIKHMRPYHVCVYARNYDGLHDLYRLVTKSHIDYLAEVPKLPRSELQALRKNLLVGSACFNGEIYDIARTRPEDHLKKAIEFYDYIEIQPLENYSYLVNMEALTEEEVKRYCLDIINASEDLGKMVVATGDCHYCDPKDKIFRDVYIQAKGVGGVNHPLNPYSRSKRPYFENPDQHFRGTDEMLEEFKYLGEEKALEYVVTNTNKIADMCEVMVPLPNDHLFTPKIPNCPETLTKLCFDKAHELYGDPLPKLIEDRLNAELNGIISNGYAVIYYIAHKLVKKANEDGYVVGSRGSVGSSFVATMSGITEVNALPPHYRCPKCKHLEWSKEEYPNILSGYDLPDKRCPICGELMVRDGQDIPFETFLGFHADKTPDIDLNFPRDYQWRAHDYTKVLLGPDNVFRAGTIETVAEKTAFGFARGYFERIGMDPNKIPKAKIAYLASGCTDVKRTTGQHPGGIVVIPDDNEVYDFTAVQYPADDPNSAWKTTHFDFTSMHDTILKLDLLGHLDPMALRMLTDLTGLKIEDIPLNDPKVISLFSTNKALNLKRNYLGEPTGALALPEFGTEFVRGILNDTKPTTFAELVIISGLSHGTGVWLGNAYDLIKKGIATLNGVIGCRDDIMTYLISKGLDPSMAFTIMEKVRKGKGLAPDFEAAMLEHNVPRYYIESCKQIQYLFPKGHATAYVMMAIRVGYFKVYYPLEFYATFFTVRSKQYDLKPMIEGEEAIIKRLEELKFKDKSKVEKLTPKEVEQQKTLNIAIEMVQRGYKFSNIDLYRSDASKFVIDKENNALIPPFIVLDGLGEAAAITVVEARKNGEFTSIEDVERRTGLNQTNIKELKELGVFKDLPDTDQLNLFDFTF